MHLLSFMLSSVHFTHSISAPAESEANMKYNIIMSLCRFIYPSLEISQFLVHLNTQDNKIQLTRAFCQLHQLRRPGDVVGDIVRNSDDEVSKHQR